MEEYVHNKWKGEVKYKLQIILRFLAFVEWIVKRYETKATNTQRSESFNQKIFRLLQQERQRVVVTEGHTKSGQRQEGGPTIQHEFSRLLYSSSGEL